MKSGVTNLLVFATLCICGAGRAATNIFTREIRYEKPAVLVLDHLRVNEELTGIHPFGIIYEAARKGKTDPKEFIPELLKGQCDPRVPTAPVDDLEVQNCRMTFDEGCLDLRITSKVTFATNRPSKLSNVMGFGGMSALTASLLSGEDDVILIYNDAGGKLLWFPDFGVPDNFDSPDDLAAAVIWRMATERLFPRDLRVTCSLNVGGKVETLFDLDYSRTTTNVPSAAFLRRLQEEHPMSWNDLSRLFSALKLAKGGYYNIDTSGFTNVFPGPALSVEGLAIKEKTRHTKFQIDGSFADWKEYKTGWSGDATNRPFRVINGALMDSGGAVNITECDYCNDQKYLYIFLKFKPSLESRYKGPHRTGRVANLSLGTHKDKLGSGSEEFARADFEVAIPYGCYSSSFEGEKDSEGSYVSYKLTKRDVDTKQFSIRIREESSREGPSLIGHGKDGVELAIRLSDLRKKSGDRLVLRCMDGGFPIGNEHVFPLFLE